MIGKAIIFPSQRKEVVENMKTKTAEGKRMETNQSASASQLFPSVLLVFCFHLSMGLSFLPTFSFTKEEKKINVGKKRQAHGTGGEKDLVGEKPRL